MTRAVTFGIAALLWAWTSALNAGAPCCGGCGCQPYTRKVCRLVCEMREETKPVYECKCEDFCIPGPSTCCKTPCTCPGKCCQDHTVWKPTCGCVKQRTVLVIKKESKKVPSYKCVVEEVCTRCGHCARSRDYPGAADAATALAMVKNVDIDQVIGAEATPPANHVSAPEATLTTACRTAFDRTFSRK
jgi:hypothetical protein